VDIDATATAGQMNSISTPKPPSPLREQGIQRLRDITLEVEEVKRMFEKLDYASVSEATMDRLNEVKNHLHAAGTAISVDKAHMDIRHAQEVKKRAEEFLDSMEGE